MNVQKNRIHNHLVISVVDALMSIFLQGFYADKVIERAIQAHPKWGGRDRRFFAESVYEIVRWKRKLEFCAGIDSAKTKQDFHLLFIVWWYLDRHEFLSEPSLSLTASAIEKKLLQVQKNSALKESIPDWLDELGRRQLGAQWDKNIAALNQKAPVVLRANTLLTTKERLREELSKESIEAYPILDAPDALVLKERKNVFITKSFKSGFFEVQDASSQNVAEFMNLSPGQRVIDACAGAGGKSLHIAALLKNKGKIISMDIENRKLVELKKRAARAKVDVIETRCIENAKTIKRLEESADRVLLDVPCSGMGVLKRNPDSKWKMLPEKYAQLLEIQKDILNRYSMMVKKGGILVYSTCSILPSENLNQVEQFLETHPDWKLEDQKPIYPAENAYDGFYMARLKRV